MIHIQIMQKIIILAMLVSSFSAFARIDYESFCKRVLKDQVSAKDLRPVLPDSRSAQEIVKALDRTTREFHALHTNYDTSSLLAAPEGNQQNILLKPEGAKVVLDNIGNHLRFTREIEKGEFIPAEDSSHHPRTGWVIEDGFWLTSGQPKNAELREIKNIRLYSTLYPSAEFPDLVRRGKAFESFLKREVEFLRFHPTVVAYVPVDVAQRAFVNVGERIPELWLPSDEVKKHQEERAMYKDFVMPVYSDIYTERGLAKAVEELKAEIDAALGSRTDWTLSARTVGNYPFAKQTQLMVKIDHPTIEIAWRASLEFIERYGALIKRRAPHIKEPSPDAIAVGTSPAVKIIKK